jgi:hypothetical protein
MVMSTDECALLRTDIGWDAHGRKFIMIVSVDPHGKREPSISVLSAETAADLVKDLQEKIATCNRAAS